LGHHGLCISSFFSTDLECGVKYDVMAAFSVYDALTVTN
jgi:hypothetical protein